MTTSAPGGKAGPADESESPLRGFRAYDYEVRDTDDAERDAWLEGAAGLAFTHSVRYQPCFTIRVKLPPWVDPHTSLAEASAGWNDELCAAGEPWTEPGGYAWLDVTHAGSTQTIAESEADPGGRDPAAPTEAA
jgi:hypothetical protein